MLIATRATRSLHTIPINAFRRRLRVLRPFSTETGAKIIFSGIQPTGVPHLGNYLGALRQWVALQNHARKKDQLLYCVVDLHAVTVPQDPSQLRKWRRETLAMLLAVGLDPERCTIFYQSSVSDHGQLMSILGCVASFGQLSRMTQWKVGNLPRKSSRLMIMPPCLTAF